ncbi:MAG TPA: HEAT repeat domain-containing protein [Chthonomonadaceae bacterium]|nr:HEAT repeat domain-containing protein [Chthonomonadaceae bacterium]
MSIRWLDSGQGQRKIVVTCAIVSILALSLTVLARHSGTPPLAYRLEMGSRLTYRVDYTGTAHADIRPLFSDQNSKPTGDDLVNDLKIHWHGDLLMTVLDPTPDGYRVVYRWRADTITAHVNSLEAPSMVTQLQEGLDKEILATLDPHGRIVSVRLDPALDPFVQGAVRALMALPQCVLSTHPEGSAQPWEAEEDDPNGVAMMRYTPTGVPAEWNGGRVTLRKTYLRYLPSQEPPLAGDHPVERDFQTEGDRTIRFDAGAGRVESQQIEETQTTRVAGKVIATTQTHFALQFAGQEGVPAEELTALRAQCGERERNVPAMALSVQPTRAEQEAVVQRKALGAATPKELLGQLEQAERLADATLDTTPLALKLKALVSVHPEVCTLLSRKLALAPAGSLTMRLLTSALDSVGSQEAQSAVVAAIEARPDDWPALQRLIPPLGAAPAPTPEAQAILEALAAHSGQASIASTAQLALGSMAFHMAQNAPERAAQIVDETIERLVQAKQTTLVTRLLLTLGNAGSPRSAPALLSYLASGDPEIRAVAAYALRWIDTPTVNAKLETLLTSDPQPQVRLQAANSLHFHPKTSDLITLEKQVYAAETDAHVRLAILADLWQAHSRFPETVTVVTQAADNDRDADIRRAAGEMLKSAEKR